MRAPMIAAAAIGLSLAALAGVDAPFGERRSVTVEKPGWVRIALDGHTLARLDELPNWRVFDAAGTPVPARVLAPVRGLVPAQALSSEKNATDTAYVLGFDLGPTPLRHDACNVVPDREVDAQGCTLEGSRDGKEWSPLAAGTIFRIGSGTNLQSAKLSYPASECRYLRLSWPASAGLPKLQSVSVATTSDLPAPRATCELQVTEDAPVRGAPTFRVDCLSQGFETIELDVAARERCAYVFERCFDTGWRKLAAATLATTGDVTTLRVQAPGFPAREQARMRFFGGNTKLLAARGTFEPRWLLFEARVPGAYAFQALPAWLPAPASASELALDQVKEPLLDLALGAPTPLPAPALPNGFGAPYAPSQRMRIIAAYKVLADAAPGTIVDIDLHPEVQRRLTDGKTDLGLRAGTSILPCMITRPTLHATLFEARGLAPQPAESPKGESSLSIAAPEDLCIADHIEIALPPRTAPRSVSVALKLTPRPGVEHSTCALGRVAWDDSLTRDNDLIPCEGSLHLTVPRERWESLELTFDNGNLPPVTNVTVTLFRPRAALRCVWPASAGVEVTLVPSEAAVDLRHSLVPQGALLLAMPAKEAHIDITTAVEAESSAEKTRRGWFTAALAVVAGVLVLVLARALKAKPSEAQKTQ
jgi:hypothetical protein